MDLDSLLKLKDYLYATEVMSRAAREDEKIAAKIAEQQRGAR